MLFLAFLDICCLRCTDAPDRGWSWEWRAAAGAQVEVLWCHLEYLPLVCVCVCVDHVIQTMFIIIFLIKWVLSWCWNWKGRIMRPTLGLHHHGGAAWVPAHTVDAITAFFIELQNSFSPFSFCMIHKTSSRFQHLFFFYCSSVSLSLKINRPNGADVPADHYSSGVSVYSTHRSIY